MTNETLRVWQDGGVVTRGPRMSTVIRATYVARYGPMTGDSELNLLASNVLLLDSLAGVVQTNIGVKDGWVVAAGRVGSPNAVDDSKV
ncbi:hypothetical protein ACGFNU_47615 [Spirillospora sp. NPDC048911]|uniref:hypothetical protein n=1 Tax=Spirillospora sp. NPDC048911 TaxID=3364527 RepID=UPI00371A35A8